MGELDLGDGVTLFTSDVWRDPGNPPRAMTNRQPGDVYEFIGHYTGESADARLRRDSPVEWLQAICDYHQQGRRYADIAYHSAVVSDDDGPFDGQVFECRDNAFRGGHTLAEPPDGVDHNMRGHGVVVLHMQAGDQITEKCKLALRKMYGLACISAGWRTLQTSVHSDHKPTACPGPSTREFFKTELLVPAPAPDATPPPAPDPGPGPAPDRMPWHGKFLKEGSTGPLVVDWQESLRALGFNPGKADGKFGPKTRRATTRFQQAYELEPDGIVGPLTYRAAFG